MDVDEEEFDGDVETDPFAFVQGLLMASSTSLNLYFRAIAQFLLSEEASRLLYSSLEECSYISQIRIVIDPEDEQWLITNSLQFDEFMTHLGAAMSSMKTLRSIMISGTSTNVMRSLSLMLQNSMDSLNRIFISCLDNGEAANPEGDLRNARQIASSLHFCPSVESVFLHGIPTHLLIPICEGFASSGLDLLQEVHLNGSKNRNEITDFLTQETIVPLGSLKALSLFTISDFLVENQGLSALADVIGSHDRLNYFKSETCVWQGESSSLVALALAKSQSLMTFNATGTVVDGSFFTYLSHGLCENEVLRRLALPTTTGTAIDSDAASACFEALGQCSSIEAVQIPEICWTDGVCDAFRQAFDSSTMLGVELDLTGVQDAYLERILLFLQSNVCADSLSLRGANGECLRILATILEKGNRTLETLQVHGNVTPSALTEFVGTLNTNTSLKTLKVSPGVDCDSDERAEKFLAAVRTNYSLETIESLTLPSHWWPVSPLKCILRLNKAGRRYLVHGRSNGVVDHSPGLAVLASVKDDLTCLYLHLHENPFLCQLLAQLEKKSGKHL